MGKGSSGSKGINKAISNGRSSAFGVQKGAKIGAQRLFGARIGKSWKKWLGSTWKKGTWKSGKGKDWKRRRRRFSSEDSNFSDEFKSISEELDRLKIEHYYGYYTDDSLVGLALQKSGIGRSWSFNCSQFRMEFRTHIMFFRMGKRPDSRILQSFRSNISYLLVSGITTASGTIIDSFASDVPCKYSNVRVAALLEGSVKPEKSKSTLPKDSVKSKDSQSVCFPAGAQVSLSDGSTVRMDKLAVGDHVVVGSDKVSEVFMFTHKVPIYAKEFVELSTDSGASVQLTHGHYIYAN
eukprot:IDg20789t1